MKVSKFFKMHGMLVLTLHPDITLAEAARRFTQTVGQTALDADNLTEWLFRSDARF